MANSNEAIERNNEATTVLRAYLSKVEPKLVTVSLNELVEVLRARYEAASDINPERITEVRKLQLSLVGFSDRNLVEKICQDEIMIDILYEFMKQNISVNEIMVAISSINKQPITDNIPSFVSNKAELTEEETASSQYQSALNV